VGAFFNYLAFAKYNDLVCPLDCGQSMGNCDCGPFLRNPVECGLDYLFRLCIESTCRFVEDDDAGFLDDTSRDSNSLLLVTDANCDTEGIILSIVTWTDDAIEARFMCRAHVTPRSQFKIKKPDPAQWQNRPGSLGPGSENGRILAPRNIANLALRTGSSGNNQTDGIGPLEEGGPTDRTGLPGERGARVIGRDRKERKKAKKASNGSQAPDDEFKEWKKKNDPAHGIVAPVAYGIQDCKIILVE
jgi:hypothetical protein